jgi:hypothetical protein
MAGSGVRDAGAPLPESQLALAALDNPRGWRARRDRSVAAVASAGAADARAARLGASIRQRARRAGVVDNAGCVAEDTRPTKGCVSDGEAPCGPPVPPDEVRASRTTSAQPGYYAERARSRGPAASRGATGDGQRGVSGPFSILLPPSPASQSLPASFQPNQLAASPATTTGRNSPTFRISR